VLQDAIGVNRERGMRREGREGREKKGRKEEMERGKGELFGSTNYKRIDVPGRF